MVVVMEPDARAEDVNAVVRAAESAGARAYVSRGVRHTVIGLVGDAERVEALGLRRMRAVADVRRVSTGHQLVSREHRPARSVVEVRGVPIDPGTLTLIAGPCAVEDPEQALAAAQMALAAGARLLRGGAFKPRTSPYAFPGWGSGACASSTRCAGTPGSRW